MNPVLSLPTKCLWSALYQPADPAAMLAALPGEARRLRGLGAGAVELWAEVVAIDERYASPEVWREAAAVLGGEGLAATVHLPLTWVDLTSLDRDVWEGSLRSIETTLRAVEPLAPQMAAVHPSNYATQAALAQRPPADRASFLGVLGARLVAALSRLKSGPGGRVLAVENLEGVPADLLGLVAQASGARICLDAGHALADGSDPVALLGQLGERVIGLHLHDAGPRGGSIGAGPGPEAEERAHLPLGDGRLDLPALVAALHGTGFAGPVVLEVVGAPGGEERSAAAFLSAVNRAR